MKIYAYLVFSFFLLYPQVGAQNEILFQVNTDKFSILDTIEVTLEITSQDSQIQDIKIPGIENFEVFSQSSSQKIQTYDNQIRNIFTLLLDIKPKKIGTYTLGPVVYGTGNLQVNSSTLEISVVGDRIQKKSGVSKDLDEIVFQDRLRNPNKNLFLIAFSFAIILLCTVVFFIFFKRYTSQNQTNTQNIVDIKTRSIKEKLLEYKKTHNHIDQAPFYVGLNSLLREYFASLGVMQASEKTYTELSQEECIPLGLRNSFKNSYFAEFSPESIDIKNRDEIFGTIISHF